MLGSTISLGCWKEVKAVMKWHPGDVWKFSFVAPINKSFQYKYVLFDKHQSQKWEKGTDRSINLELNTNQLVVVRDVFRYSETNLGLYKICKHN